MNPLKINEDNPKGAFYWDTSHSHPNNTFTMNEFLQIYLPNGFEIVDMDGSYVEIQDMNTEHIFILNAKGDGDWFHHCVEWSMLI